MYDYFYNFYKKPFAFDLFNRDSEDGTPSPPSSDELLSNDSQVLLSNDGQELLSNEN